jgi:hypothetical protein
MKTIGKINKEMSNLKMIRRIGQRNNPEMSKIKMIRIGQRNQEVSKIKMIDLNQKETKANQGTNSRVINLAKNLIN